MIQAIINRTGSLFLASDSNRVPLLTNFTIMVIGNNWEGFPFLFALCLAASLVIWLFVDVKKGRKDALQWAEERVSASKRHKEDFRDSGEETGDMTSVESKTS